MKNKYSRTRRWVSPHKLFIIRAAGYLCMAATWWILGILIISWLSLDVIPDLILNVLYLISSLFLFIITLFSWLTKRRNFDQIIFLSMALLFFCLFLAHLLFPEKDKIVQAYNGWYALVWALFFAYAWMLALKRKAGLLRILFIFAFCIGTLAAAFSAWINGYTIVLISGYVFLISSILALAVSIMEIFRYFRERYLGTGEGVSITTIQI